MRLFISINNLIFIQETEGLTEQIKLKQIKTETGYTDHVFCCVDYCFPLFKKIVLKLQTGSMFIHKGNE